MRRRLLAALLLALSAGPSPASRHRGHASEPLAAAVGSALSGADVTERLHALERAIAGLPREQGFVLSADARTVLVAHAGTESRVLFSSRDVDRMQGALLSHCHPNRSSFSDADVELACAGEALEMRAVSRNPDGSFTTFVIDPPLGAKRFSYSDWMFLVKPLLARAMADAYRETRARFTGASFYGDEANRAWSDRIWQIVARDTGLVYRREDWR